MRRLALLVALLALAAAQPTYSAAQQQLSCRPREQCCKVCSKGQACGNSCISASSTCRKGRGCACDASEVCR